MVDAAPFHALRYDPAVAGDPASTSAPAYDELERFAYARHRTASPYTVLELIAAAAPDAYEAAGAAYRRWRRTGVLVRDPQPAFFVYEEHELRSGVPAVQRGLLAAVRIDDTGEEILAHEDVQPQRVTERLRRLEAVPVDLAPVYTFAPALSAELQALLARRPRTRPVVAATDERGIDHRVWRVGAADDVASIRTLLRDTGLVIADGHHRYAAAMAFRDRCRQRPATGAAESPCERILVYVVDARTDGTQIHAVHRLVRPFPLAALDRLAADFILADGPADPIQLRAGLARAEGRAFGLRLPGGTSRILLPKDDAALATRLPQNRSERWRNLDTAVLEYAVLRPLGLSSTVEYHADLVRATAEVESGGPAALFVLRPVDVDTVAALASVHEPMPAKTTYFRPKPRAGLLMREVEAVAE